MDLPLVLALAAKGLKLFPLKANSKKPPLVDDWEAAASCDTKTLTDWHAKHPGCNWGIATGPSGLCVLDVDVKKNKNGINTLLGLEFDHGDIPETMQVSTPTGGVHYYLCGRSLSSVERLGAGLDTRSDGGYVVAPGSAIDGVPYAIQTPHPIADAPPWLIQVIGRPVDRKAAPEPTCTLDSQLAIDQATYYLRNAPIAVEGHGGDATTFKVASRAKDFGISEDVALDLMAKHWNERCEPPWSHEELATKVANAYLYGQQPPGVASAEAAFADIPVDTTEPAKLPAMAVCAAELREQDIKPRPWILGYRFIRGYMTTTVAPGGVGKSMHSILEAISVASGKPLSGDPVHERTGVWLYNTEDPIDELSRRVVGAVRHHGLHLESLRNLFLSSGRRDPLVLVVDQGKGPVVNKSAIDKAKRFIDENRIGLVVLDPFVRLHRVSENDNMAIDLVTQCISRICDETGCAIHVVHHTRKSSATEWHGDMDSARGAGAFQSAARIAHTLCGMSEKQAGLLELNGVSHKYFVRLDDAKANMAPPEDKVRWFRKRSVALSTGEKVGVMECVDLTEKPQVEREEDEDVKPRRRRKS